MHSADEVESPAIGLGELQTRAVRGSLWTVVFTVVNLPLSFAANAVIARSLGLAGYGRLAFLTVLINLAIPITNFGFNSAAIQRGSRAEANGRQDEVDELLGRNVGFQALIELPLLIIIGAAITRNDQLWETVAVVGGLAATSVFSGAALAVTIENRSAAGAKLALVASGASQAITVVVAILTSSAPAVFAARTLASGAGFALILVLLDRRRRRAALRPRLPQRLGHAFWRYALFSWASGLVGLLLFSRSEVFLLRAFHRTEAVGLFALAYGLSQQITAPADALLPPLLPAVAGILSRWPERAAEAFDRSTRVSAVVCGAIVAFAMPPLVLSIPVVYGSSFKTAAWLLAPLALVSALQSVNNPVAAFLNARERADLVLKTRSAGLAVNVVTALALIPMLGVWGAAAANATGQLCGLSWLATQEPLVRSRLRSGIFRLYSPFAVGVVAGGAALAAGAGAGRLTPGVAITISCCTGILCFVIGLRYFRNGLTVDDREALLGAVFTPARPHLMRLLRPVTTRSV